MIYIRASGILFWNKNIQSSQSTQLGIVLKSPGLGQSSSLSCNYKGVWNNRTERKDSSHNVRGSLAYSEILCMPTLPRGEMSELE